MEQTHIVNVKIAGINVRSNTVYITQAISNKDFCNQTECDTHRLETTEIDY